jgi:hypothetical protein
VQTPAVQVSLEEHSLQMPPFDPHAAEDVPGLHRPSALQQPPQVAAVHATLLPHDGTRAEPTPTQNASANAPHSPTTRMALKDIIKPVG